jgi:hypothetical protein
MMRFLFFLLGSAIPTALAQSSAGSSGGATGKTQAISNAAGVDAMWAQICGPNGLLCNVGTDIVTFLANKVFDLIVPMLVGVAVLMVIYAGLRIVFSQGKDDAVGEAKKIIGYAVVGVILAGLSLSIIGFIAWVLRGLLS